MSPHAKAGAIARNLPKKPQPHAEAGAAPPAEKTLAAPAGTSPEAKAKAKAKAKGKAKSKSRGSVMREAELEAEMADVAQSAADEAAAEAAAVEKKEAEEAKKKEKRAAAGKPEKEVDVKRWLLVQDWATGEQQKLLLSFKMDTTEFRRALARATAVPMKELCFEIDGHEWVEAREIPLNDFDETNQVVTWWRSDRLRRLLEKRELATINNLDKFERSAFHFSVMDGDLELTQDIVCDADFKFSLMNKQDIFGDTALHYACILGYPDIVELLLDKQSDPEIQNINRRTPTHLASEHGHGMVMRALIRQGACIGPNPEKGAWKYPQAKYFAQHNGRNKVIREIQFKETEERAMAEMENALADMDF